MKFLYAQGDTFAIARFTGEDVLVGVISKSDTPETVRLPLGTWGQGTRRGSGISSEANCTGRMRTKAVLLQIEPHGSYLFECQ